MSTKLAAPTVLKTIFDRKTEEVAERQKRCPISELELASRLSFFLWSSIPDEELLNLAERGELRRPDVLEQQVARMLADPRARALVENLVRDEQCYLTDVRPMILFC